jgi:hypothetical protein
MKRTMALVILVAALCGCHTTSQDLNRLNLGMTKQQVVGTLGEPHTTAAQGNIEFLTYWLDRENMGGKDEYFVKLVDGKVTTYGHKGDFGTAVMPLEQMDIHNH